MFHDGQPSCATRTNGKTYIVIIGSRRSPKVTYHLCRQVEPTWGGSLPTNVTVGHSGVPGVNDVGWWMDSCSDPKKWLNYGHYVAMFIASFHIISYHFTFLHLRLLCKHDWESGILRIHAETCTYWKNMLKSSSCVMTSSWLNWRKKTLYIIPLHLHHCVLLYHVYHPPKTSPLREVSQKKSSLFYWSKVR